MARIVRPMKKANDGLPLLGTKANCLGVRPLSDVDLKPPGDVLGDVVSNHKGLSVSADWRTLLPHLIPEHLEDDSNGACGKNMAVYVHGNNTGPFAEGEVGPGLELVFKAGKIDVGVIRPMATVALTKYQDDLKATRLNWKIDES